jgi:hypothetical protein
MPHTITHIAVLFSIVVPALACSPTPQEQPLGPAVSAVSAPAPDPGLLLTIMFQLGEDMNALSDALWRNDLDTITAAATAIAEHPHVSPAERERLQGALGDRFPDFVEGDRRVHESAARLAELAATGETGAILGELAELQAVCVACHESFRGALSSAP